MCFLREICEAGEHLAGVLDVLGGHVGAVVPLVVLIEMDQVVDRLEVILAERDQDRIRLGALERLVGSGPDLAELLAVPGVPGRQCAGGCDVTG
jgi:hypothetical protein